MSTKSKTREFEIGWWQLLPLAERDHRPVVWSSSSIIFVAHRVKPCVIGRHFPSLKAFELPSPPSVNQSLNSYEPPTVLCISPDGNWLFAYFPARDVDGVGCVWLRGVESDDWSVKEFWSFPRGAGVVTGTWVSSYRQWVVSRSGSPRRMPPRGPSLPLSFPVLILVTQPQQLEVWYMQESMSLFCVLRASLSQPSTTVENLSPSSLPDLSYNPIGTKLCVTAAIGVGYNESSIIVAMRTCLYPPPIKNYSDHTRDLDFSLNMPPHEDPASRQSDPSNDWELWGEESLIELCEVQIQYDNFAMSLTTKPMPPIARREPCLSSLKFIPSFIDITHARGIVETPTQSPLRLAAHFISFDDYSSVPQTTLSLYSFTRNEIKAAFPWSIQLMASRTYTDTPLAFVAPVPGTPNLLAGILNTNELFQQKKSRAKEIPVGRLVMLRLNNLTDDEDWAPSTILAPFDGSGIDLPLTGTVSPNNILVCCTSSSADMSSPISVQSAPCRQTTNNMEGMSSRLSGGLVSSVYGRLSPADIIHVLAKPSSSLDLVSEVLLGVLGLLEKHNSGTRRTWIRELLGIEIEVYRTKARHAEGEFLKELNSCWNTIHDFCTITAYNSAFEDCREGDAYDLEAVWQLVRLSNWVMEFTERLLKECLLFVGNESEQDDDVKMEERQGVLLGLVPPSFESEQSRIPHILLHLIHPYGLATLHSLLNHVKHFRGSLGGLSAAAETVQMAKDVLLDVVDYSAIDLLKLEPLLLQFGYELKALDSTALRQSLVRCRPTSSSGRFIRKFANMISSSQVVDKPRLFIKPVDLIDGISRVSLSPGIQVAGVGKERDIISKGILSHHGKELVCSRCGGKKGANIGQIAGHTSLRWNAWERVWNFRCICGGMWRSMRKS